MNFSNKAKPLLPLLALALSVALYALHFFAGGGREKLINDSDAYLFMARGGHLDAPYNVRLLGPFLAHLIASIFGISALAAFQILTPIALFGSLIMLRRLISERGGSVEFQSAVLLAFGCALAATFGYTPVMVDPLLLALTSLTLAALEKKQIIVAIAFATLGALTKEYGLLLALVTALIAYRNGKRRLALIGILVPGSVMLALLTGSNLSGPGLWDWQRFVSAMFGYHIHLFHFRGAADYLKILYMWSWSALWPIIVIAAGAVFFSLRNRLRMTDSQAAVAVMLLSMPLLLLGDWGRALLIVVPFAIVVSAAHPLAKDRSFALLLAVGGPATALARPFHSSLPPPRALTIAMIVVSVAASSMIAVRILKFVASKSGRRVDEGMDVRSPEVALP